jgi:hypothetical protein
MEVNATILGPFHHLSLAIMVSFSTPPRTPPASSHATHNHNIIYIHRHFIQRFVKSNIHILEFAIVLGQYSYFYRLGETGCYIDISCVLDEEIQVNIMIERTWEAIERPTMIPSLGGIGISRGKLINLCGKLTRIPMNSNATSTEEDFEIIEFIENSGPHLPCY